MELILKRAVLLLFISILLIQPFTLAKTRNSSVKAFLDITRRSPEGFADTESGEVNIQSTTYALDISRIINYDVNNTLDILLYYQRSQNDDGGFGSDPNSNSTWEDTVSAVQGLLELNINNTQLSKWQISDYLNVTADQLFYSYSIVNNQTQINNNDLTLDLIIKWKEYIYASYIIGVIPAIPNVFLNSALKSLQLTNGSYSNFNLAVHSIKLLNLIAQQPEELELSSKFIRAYAVSDGLFSPTLNGSANLEATYHAIDALDKLGKLGELDQKREIILKILEQQKSDSGFSDLNSDQVTLEDTWYAIHILSLLDSLDELLRPDVLQTQGFIPLHFLPFLSSLTIMTLFVRRKIQ